MTWRAVFAFFLVLMIAASIGMAVGAVEHSPGWLLNPGAATYLRETWMTLMVYAGAIVLVVANRGEEWDDELRNAAKFGTIAGLIDVASIALERIGSTSNWITAMTLAAMLVMLALWGFAGARTALELHRFRPGVMAAVMSAGVCMVIAVAAGFAIELYIAPPRPDSISTWAEFKRSGWMDAQAFGIANTLDSAFTHLLLGPVVALVLGSPGAWLGARRRSQRKSDAAS